MFSKILVLIFWVIKEEVTQEKTPTGKETPKIVHTGETAELEEADQKTADNIELQVDDGKEVNDVDYHISPFNPPA